MIQWLSIHVYNSGGTGSIPGWGTKISHMSTRAAKKEIIKRKKTQISAFFPPQFKCNKTTKDQKWYPTSVHINWPAHNTAQAISPRRRKAGLPNLCRKGLPGPTSHLDWVQGLVFQATINDQISLLLNPQNPPLLKSLLNYTPCPPTLDSEFLLETNWSYSTRHTAHSIATWWKQLLGQSKISVFLLPICCVILDNFLNLPKPQFPPL